MIMEAALEEFGARSYGEASMNTISKEGGISKGIIYHYFKDKDELYLACLQQYFDSRIIFFDKNPVYLKLFCGAVITPPPHLSG